MPKVLGKLQTLVGGIADSNKAGSEGQAAFERGTEFRRDAKKISVLPAAVLDSGTTATDLPMWGVRACNDVYSQGNAGAIYKKADGGTWSKEHTASDSQGNGLAYFGEDGNLYYGQNTTIGRLTRVCDGDGQYYDDFLGTEGGEPTNTKSVDLERSSSMYAHVADNANLSITSDLTLETYAKLESLPQTDEIYNLMGKWNENGQRSYKMDITTASSVFGDGRDGSLTISADTTDDPHDANCVGTLGTNTLTLSNIHGSFNPSQGDKVFIHQTRGTGAGSNQFAVVKSWSSPTLTLEETLNFSPVHSSTESTANKAQVLIAKQYVNVTVDTGFIWSAKAFDGFKGGIMSWFANGTFTYNGLVYGRGREVRAFDSQFGGGFIGGAGSVGPNQKGGQGESIDGFGGAPTTRTGGSYKTTTTGTRSTSKNVSGGGGGTPLHGGGAGGHANDGQSGDVGEGGSSAGSANLSTIVMGSGGGGGGTTSSLIANAGTEGGGGGALFASWIKTVATSTGSVVFDGGDVYPPGSGSGDDEYPGGGGSGGSVKMYVKDATFATDSLDATGGTSFIRRGTSSIYGGDGSDGRIAIYYGNSVSGSLAIPVPIYVSDASLTDTDGYVLRLLVSSDGTAEEIFQWDITSILNTGLWTRWQITWEDTTSTAQAFANGSSLGTLTGSVASIFDSTADFAIGADFNGSGTAQNFFDGLQDDPRLWNDVRTSTELISKNDTKLIGNEGNLVGYWEFEDDFTDSQTNVTANNLTNVNSPTFSTDVPFSGLTTRKDEDLSNTVGTFTGQYTLTTGISELDADRLYFAPTQDPQKSVILSVDTVGTGDWTVTVHDPLNRVVSSITVANSEMSTGFYEFMFDSVWRPIIGVTYHIHITSTVADGIIDVAAGETTLSDGSDTIYVYFSTHYQFLVSDEYHPMLQIVNKLAIGNGRYLATIEGGDIYTPQALTLPSGYRIRSLAYWRDYLAIGVWRGDEITDYDQGYIFFWDGISDNYNDFVYVPEGGINTMYGVGNILYASAGYNGEVVAYAGGDLQKLRRLPELEDDSYVELAPGAMTAWRSLVTFGGSFNTDSNTFHQGVYTYGTKDRKYPISLGYSYPTSLGDQQSSSVKIGTVFPAGQDLYIGWQNGSNFGIDRVSVTGSDQATSTIEMLIADLTGVSKDDYPLVARVDHDEIVEGQSIVIKMKADRGNWITLVTQTKVGADNTRATINHKMKEMQIAVDRSTTTGAQPDIYEVSIESDVGNDINI